MTMKSALELVFVLAVAGGVLAGPTKDAKAIPQHPKPLFDPNDVTFHLWTKAHPDTVIEMYIGDLNEADIDFSKSTKFIVHGYQENGFVDWVRAFKDKYFMTTDINIITVDWENPANTFFYDDARENTKPTGFVIGEFMSYLSSQGANLTDVHCIGYGLGAHACGAAGKNLTLHLPLGRITGLDPSQDGYDYNSPLERLYPTDASFIDVIHTCGGDEGFMEPLGHVDFYPNDASCGQPGCGIMFTSSCSHERSVAYFDESILSATFVALLCDSWDSFLNGNCDFNDETAMGEPTSVTATHGLYYLKTHGQPPYAMG